MITPSQHVYKDGYVLIVKCLNRDGTSYGGFVWPKSGPVENKKWSRDPDCDSGGLFGWPWGMGIGDGKDPDACAPWLVFRAKAENVIAIGAKCKAVPGENGELPEVIYYGTQAGAVKLTAEGRSAFIIGNSSSASSSGDRSVACITGEYSTIHVGKNAIGAITGNRFHWRYENGASLLCQWTKDGKKMNTRLFKSVPTIKNGTILKIEYGKIVKEFTED
jgi:hypothetical protein